MKINEIEIKNFKAIKKLSLRNLTDVVVIAGPNGCGKSCILDAIRFLKVSYAGYRQQDEWRNFFSEFQLDINNPDEIKRLFYDPSKPIKITASFSLSKKEIDYLQQNVKTKIKEILTQQDIENKDRNIIHQLNAISDTQKEGNETDQQANEYGNQIIAMLNESNHTASVTLDPTTFISVDQNIIFYVLFRSTTQQT